MTSNPPPTGGVVKSKIVQAKEHGQLLDVIDELRAQGVSHYVPLPQLIVTGDQSAGKSSVLEAVSGIRFPVKDNLCTRFATELILRRGIKETFSVSITPNPRRSEKQKKKIVSNFNIWNAGLQDLGAVTEKAKEAMGLNSDSDTFSKDVLRIEVTGPNQPNLTLVDLPGLIHAENEKQSEKDITLVSELVDEYMKSPRSIILAVVSAKSDYANQVITTRAREVDPNRVRTFGIITKPDTLDKKSEMEKDYAELVRTEKARGFRLGWHVLKNRDFEHRNCSDEERDDLEAQFFSQGVWAGVSSKHKGIVSLRPRLSAILRDHIVSQVPSLLQEVESGIQDCKNILESLGEARATRKEQRLYLLRVCQSFSVLVKDAVDSNYHHS